ncbi:PilZ domain-containing protein [Pseudomonas indica]|uniref:PilZ domain-containing protein n=1 Tax=Pseudomonas indica TaxID=137658 RepID=UPI0023F63035|nr:PilZ domain-containing protein [Pseudomonas indica]MBU3058081.1 PilZ domain-containing protein [Pseudomonas indica]
MSQDTLRIEVPDLLEESCVPLAHLNAALIEARQQRPEQGLRQVLDLLSRHNRSAMTLLERQRGLQSISEEYRHYASAAASSPCPLLVGLCNELATGFKRLLLQMLQGRAPSRPHLAWCLYTAQYFLGQSQLRHYERYQEPSPTSWRDSHQLYCLAERHECLDEQVAAAFQPTAASSLRGLYQQGLLLALSNPFHLAEGECLLLFKALAPLAGLARLLPWDEEAEGPTIDLREARPFVTDDHPTQDSSFLRRFEPGALAVALNEPAPLRSSAEHALLERVRPHWLGRPQRRHPRTEYQGSCDLAIGLAAIHAQLLEQRPSLSPARIVDASVGGARLLCQAAQAAQIPVGQLVLLLGSSGTSSLALVRWRHINDEGLHLGLRYLKGLARPVWLRRAPSAQTHLGILQSTPAGSAWHHGLWLCSGQFSEGEQLWLQLSSAPSQATLALPTSNLSTPLVERHPLRLA